MENDKVAFIEYAGLGMLILLSITYLIGLMIK